MKRIIQNIASLLAGLMFINPTVIGNGMPIFDKLKTNQHLKLVKSTGFECGIVGLHYEPKRDE